MGGPNKRGAELPLRPPSRSPPVLLPGSLWPGGEGSRRREGCFYFEEEQWVAIIVVPFVWPEEYRRGMPGATGTILGRRSGDVRGGSWQGLLLVLLLGRSLGSEKE